MKQMRDSGWGVSARRLAVALFACTPRSFLAAGYTLQSLTRSSPALLLVLVASCNHVRESRVPDTSSVVEHVVRSADSDSTESFYGEWSTEEIVDSIYADTLLHRDNFNPNKPDTFYLLRIIQLAELIRASADDSSFLFPETTFDEVVARQAYPFEGRRGYEATYGSAIVLSTDQVGRLLTLINNPVNFNWGECGTWEPSARFEFRHQGKVVRVLDDGCTGQFRTDYPRIKFGSLTSPRRAEYRALFGEIGLREE